MHEHEPLTNLQLLCHDCAPAPDPIFQTRTPSSFVGHAVKLGFPVYDDPKIRAEHMWVQVTNVLKGGRLRGRLLSEPMFISHLRCGDTVYLSVRDIEAEETQH